MFVAGLSGLAPAEMRKAKILCIKNGISEYKAVKASYKAARPIQVSFMLIPLFWPTLYLQRKGTHAGEQLFRERVSNAMEVWHEDLTGVDFDVNCG